ncbi:hypothetical protein C4F51_13690 [Cellvibrio sp. KB43]|uniref:Uncharacterized protein n=1 Tax=Cellvibrio polysaccharolyticus TaxID=2082724 RepID=A0A928YUR1_9GAMM|nr:hypothetical protein [Cellvibrio polysaccharolyticus]
MITTTPSQYLKPHQSRTGQDRTGQDRTGQGRDFSDQAKHEKTNRIKLLSKNIRDKKIGNLYIIDQIRIILSAKPFFTPDPKK